MPNILIAEDEHTSQRIFQSAVERMGYQAVVRNNGREALEVLLRDRSFDLLITDVMMPEMDGRELVRTVRTHSCMADIPVIVVSGKVGPKAIADLLDIGVTYFMSKPVDLGQLETYMRQCIARRRQTVGRQFCQGIASLNCQGQSSLT